MFQLVNFTCIFTVEQNKMDNTESKTMRLAIIVLLF